MPKGRPFGTFKYDSAADLRAGIDAYFEDCRERNAPYTLSGLAFALNITVQTLRNYGKTDIFYNEVARAKARCQQYAHEAVYDKEKSRGAQFDLSANYEMSERQQLDIMAHQGAPEVAKLSDAELQQRLIEAAKQPPALQDSDGSDS